MQTLFAPGPLQQEQQLVLAGGITGFYLLGTFPRKAGSTDGA